MKKTINISLFYANNDKEATEKYKKVLEAVRNVLDNSNDYLGMAIETDLDKANIK
jgi:hypothetical protein